MLLRKSPEASARQDLESVQVSGQETIAGHEHGTAGEVSRSSSAHVPPTSSGLQAASRSLAQPPTSTSAPSLVMRSSAVEGPRPTGTLASLLHGSQADEAKAYFTGLLPGKIPPPRRPVFSTGQRSPVISAVKASTVPSFTGFTGKLGSAPNGTPRFDFAAVSISRISAVHFI